MPSSSQILEFPNPLYAQFFNFRPRKGDIRRAKIIEAAIDCIATIGAENTSFESIGKRLKMLRAHVAYYYRDRDDILRDAIKFSVATGQSLAIAHMEEATTDSDRLIGFIDAMFEWAELYPKQMSVMLLLYYYASRKAEYKKLNTEIRELGAQRIAAMLKPLLSDSKNIRVTTRLIHNILTGYMVEYFTSESPMSLRKVREQAKDQVCSLVGLRSSH